MFVAMYCVVTAGPTYEPLDDVRRLTNFSTGRLGSELATFLSSHGHEVRLLLGQQASYRSEFQKAQIYTFTTTNDLRDRLRALSATPIDAIFHTAAVSDFGFGKVWLRSAQGELTEIKSGKISTRQGTLLAELVPTPKIIMEVRDWFPKAYLIGWKYEVDGDRNSVLALAQNQISDCRTDICVANGPAYGPGFGLVTRQNGYIHVPDTQKLFAGLEALLIQTTSH